jgi:hypothetical protein
MDDSQAMEATAERKAIAALGLALVGILVLPMIASALAVVFGRQARRIIRSHPGARGGGQALTAMVLGWTELALGAVGAVVYVVA